MSMPTVGAELYTVRDFVKDIRGVRESLKKVKDIGYSAVEIAGFGPVDMYEVARICKDLQLDVGSTHTGWERFKNELDEVIDEHKALECKHPAIGGLPQEYYCEDGVKKFIDELKPIAEKLNDEGMDFSYHNHNHELAKYGDRTWLAALYEEAPADLLKAEIDTYWIQAGGGDPAWWLKKCAGREPVIHLKDMRVVPHREIRMAEVGEGNLNWEAILAACEEGGVEYAMVEQDDCYGRDPFESLAISYRNLKEMGLS